MTIFDFKPGIVQDTPHIMYASVVVSLERCGSCHAPMYWDNTHNFPKYHNITLEDQMKILGAKAYSGQSFSAYGHICNECADAGLVTFECYFCNKDYPKKEVADQLGEIPDYICKTCYNTLPHAEYMDKWEELREAHRYDYE